MLQNRYYARMWKLDFLSFMVLSQIQWLCLPQTGFCIIWPASIELALLGYSVSFPSSKCMLWCRTKVWEFQQHLVAKKEQPITTCQAGTDRRMTTAEPTLAVCQHAPLPGCTALWWPEPDFCAVILRRAQCFPLKLDQISQAWPESSCTFMLYVSQQGWGQLPTFCNLWVCHMVCGWLVKIMASILAVPQNCFWIFTCTVSSSWIVLPSTLY